MPSARAQSPPKSAASGKQTPGGPPSPRPQLLNTRPGVGGRNIRPAAGPRGNFQQNPKDKARQESQAKVNE